MSLYNNTSVANNVNSQPITNGSDLLAAGLGAGVGLLGTYGATNALTGAEQNAIGTQTGAQGTINTIYGNQQGLGNSADAALSSQLGLGGTPDYSAFLNSPGFQGSLNLGNQAITRAASANGSLYTPNMLNQLGQYDTTYASSNYNNYINQLFQSAGLGAQANQGLANSNLATSGNIAQLQQNQGNANAGGITSAAGIASNLLGRAGGLFNSTTANNSGTNASSGAGFVPGGGPGGTDYSPYVSSPNTNPNVSGVDSSTGLPTDSSGNYDWLGLNSGP